jgi:hypothetical protein
MTPYDPINAAWANSPPPNLWTYRIPELVLQTPNWQRGWRVLWSWITRHEPWQAEREPPPPRWDARWDETVHIWSHVIRPGGHSPAHAALEDEGAQAVLGWWQNECARGFYVELAKQRGQEMGPRTRPEKGAAG